MNIPEPVEPGFYKYSGGNQTMIFLLLNHIIGPKEWYVITDNLIVSKCDWDYIEQALGVWALEKIV